MYKDFYKTSSLIYYSCLLEHCNCSSIGAIIDMGKFFDQLTHANLTALFKTQQFDVIQLFADVARIFEALHCIGGKHDALCGLVLAALAT